MNQIGAELPYLWVTRIAAHSGVRHIENVVQARESAGFVQQGNALGTFAHIAVHAADPNVIFSAGGGIRALGVDHELDRYFAGEKPEISELPLAPIGGEFRQAVWKILCEIPYGQVTTYGEIAKKIAAQRNRKTMSAQAVGGAVGHNPISIIIPCHRVVGSNGSLTGYAGGIDLKIKLLEHEGVDLSKFFVPKKGTAL